MAARLVTCLATTGVRIAPTTCLKPVFRRCKMRLQPERFTF
jgi:hypothetical protein